jgi:hypothetical protein
MPVDFVREAVDFVRESFSGLVGVFVALVLAFWTERRARAAADARERERLDAELVDVRRSILSSVVRNTLETRKLKRSLANKSDPYLFQIGFEVAVWEAAHTRYVALAPLDERIMFSRFFDQVRRVTRLVEFHRQTLAQVEVGGRGGDEGPKALLDDVAERLRTVADDTRLEGMVIITDHGEAVHKRMLGIREETGEAAPAA